MNTKRIVMGGLVAAGFGLIGAAHAQSPLGRTVGEFQPGTDFTCESSDGRYRECRLDGRQNVRLQRQLSRTACVEGSTWGVRRDVVWVDRGCRGQFAATSWQGGNRDDARYGDRGRWYNNQRGGNVICESPRSRHNRCAIDTRRGVVLVRQLSDTSCREGHNWGVDNGAVWVDHGCRAEFAPGNGRNWQQGWGYGNNSGYGNSGYGQPPQVIQCSSDDGRQRYCRADVYRDVQLSRQLSRADCIRGRTWGWDRGGVWVNSGCRAEFVIR